MRFSVQWTASALRELAELWTDADSAERQMITAATREIDFVASRPGVSGRIARRGPSHIASQAARSDLRRRPTRSNGISDAGFAVPATKSRSLTAKQSTSAIVAQSGPHLARHSGSFTDSLTHSATRSGSRFTTHSAVRRRCRRRPPQLFFQTLRRLLCPLGVGPRSCSRFAIPGSPTRFRRNVGFPRVT